QHPNRCSFDPGENTPCHADGRVGCRLSAIRAGAPQRLWHARPSRGLAPARPDAPSPLFLCSRSRIRMLGRWRDPSAAPARELGLIPNAVAERVLGLFASFSPVNFLNGKGITGYSQGTLGSLTC